MAQFLSLAGLAQTIAPLNIIGQGFNVTDEAQLSWYPAAFSLTLGTFILPAGRLGDMYGHRNMYMLGFAWYAVWSVVAGVAVFGGGDILFSTCRGLQGIWCALLVPNALALVGRTYGASPKKNMIRLPLTGPREQKFALFGAAAPTGWVVGAVFSSILAQLAWWPWAFWALAITCVVMIGAAFAIIPADELQPTSIRDFDILGCATGVGGLILFNFAWNQAAVVGWSTVYTYVLLIVGILLLVAFAFVEVRIAKSPVVPLRGFKAISGLTAALATGFLLSHIKVSYVLLLATLAFLIGQTLIATAPIEQTYWAQTFVPTVVMPWGMDMSFPSGTIILSNNTPKNDQGIAASLVNTAVNYSISLGLGIAGTIVRNVDMSAGTVLQGYRGAWYFGIGLDGIAVAIALYFVWRFK
ncbi:hypothetical protein LTR09_006981 [Extremus antarcticus]|uniref:Major facilitator superfamily (MFS) profile domain-containing protein n=1 Tax=Extremus antarcticus TaxID=702011 RepID=A0AAJ0DKL0_9PEZI|nr:hypothetical protein LTR09_006981 [Extremus antarcticus]